MFKLSKWDITNYLKSGANLNDSNKNGNTPIYGICYSGNPNYCEILLLTNRIKLDVINNFGDSVIIHCCRLGHSKILQLLLNYIETICIGI